jgi:hypothetical protein
MNPDYLWLTDAMVLLTFFVLGPAVAIVIAYAAWRRELPDVIADRYGLLCVASGVTAVLLFGFAKWIGADVRTAQYFLQLACGLLSGLLFGFCMGCVFPVLRRLWHWHKRTRLM